MSRPGEAARRRRSPRLLGWLAIVALLGAWLAATPAAHAAGKLSETGEESFSDIASCASTADALLVTIVVDESYSMRYTDPDAQRVDAILTALDGLERLQSETELDVQANLAVFGDTFTELVGWGPVEGEHADELRSAASDELPTRNSSNLTDYRQALSGAQASLDGRATELGEESCKLMLWLTDGKLDVDGQGDAPETDAARSEICETGGIIDGVRADAIAVVALGLLTSKGQGDVTQDRHRLQAIAEGTGGSETCGTVPVPANVTNGAYLNAEDADALNRTFAQTVALIGGGSGALSVVCPSDDCVDGRLTFPIDDGVGGVRLVLESDADAAPPQLQAPDGSTVVLDADSVTVGGAVVTTLSSNGLMTIDLRPTGSSAYGMWTLISDPTSTVVIDRYYFWGVTLVASAPDGLVIGETGEIRIEAHDHEGLPVELTVLKVAALEGSIGGEPTTFALDGDAWTAEVDLPMSDAVTSLSVTGRATAVTSPNQIDLGPVAIDQSIDTAFPPSFPSIAPTELDLGRLADTTTVTVPVTISGADRGPTRACFGAGEVTAPERAGSTSLAADEECVDVEAGQNVEVEVTFSADESADGRVHGVLPVQLFDVDDSESIEVDVPVTGTMVRPVDETARWGLVAAFTVGALLIAWVVAAISRRLLQRFDLSKFAKAAVVPVVVGPDGPRRRDARGDLVKAGELQPAPSGRLPAMTIDRAKFVTRYPWFPLSESRAEVTGTGGQVPITSVRPPDYSRPDVGRVEPSGTAGFVIITERPGSGSDTTTIDGTLIFVVDPGRGRDSHADLLPARLDELKLFPWTAAIERARQSWEALEKPGSDSDSSTRRKKGRASQSGAASDTPQPADESRDQAPARRGPTPSAGDGRSGQSAPPRRSSSGSSGSRTSGGSRDLPQPPTRRGASTSSTGSESPPAPPPRRDSPGSTGPDDRPSNSPPPRR